MVNERKIRSWKVALFLIISMLLFILFAQLADIVIEDKTLVAFDKSVATAVYAARTPEATQVMILFTSLASTVAVIVFGGAVTAYMYLTKRSRHILPLLMAMAGAGAFTFVLKEVFGRPRPGAISALVSETGFSFPSGHTLLGICFYGVLAYFLIMAARSLWLKILIAITGTVIVLGIGFSRIYLGVHWPTDVIASLLLGSSWLFFLAALFQYYDKFSYALHRQIKRWAKQGI